MDTKRKIEIFSAGCSACEDAIKLVMRIANPSCDITVLDMHDESVVRRAKSLRIGRVPAIVIDGKLAECCAVSALDETSLRRAGIGQP